jgi:methionyl-tRNA formyltransferase
MTLRAAFMGSPEFAVASLQAVARACDLRVVVSQPDRPAGRGRKLVAPAVKEAAAALGVPVLQPLKVRDGALRRSCASTTSTSSWSRRTGGSCRGRSSRSRGSAASTSTPRCCRAGAARRRSSGRCWPAIARPAWRSCRWRRASTPGRSTGALTPIDPLETSGELFERLAKLGGALLEAFLRDLPGVPPPTAQDESRMTLAPMLSKAEGLTDWTCSMSQVIDHVRGMDPWPGAFTGRGGQVLKLFAGGAVEPGRGRRTRGPGRCSRSTARGCTWPAGGGVVCVAELQVVGGKRMPAQAYAAGKPFAAGEVLADPPAEA